MRNVWRRLLREPVALFQDLAWALRRVGPDPREQILHDRLGELSSGVADVVLTRRDPPSVASLVRLVDRVRRDAGADPIIDRAADRLVAALDRLEGIKADAAPRGAEVAREARGALMRFRLAAMAQVDRQITS